MWRTGKVRRRGCEEHGADAMPPSSILCAAISRDDKHAKILPPKLTLVLLRGMRRKVNSHLALEAGLIGIGSFDRHRAAVDLNYEIPTSAVGKVQAKDKIGNYLNNPPTRARVWEGGLVIVEITGIFSVIGTLKHANQMSAFCISAASQEAASAARHRHLRCASPERVIEEGVQRPLHGV